jgi:hypothetical protein
MDDRTRLKRAMHGEKRDMPVVGLPGEECEKVENTKQKNKAVGPGYRSEFYSTVRTLTNPCHPPLSGK